MKHPCNLTPGVKYTNYPQAKLKSLPKSGSFYGKKINSGGDNELDLSESANRFT